MSESEDARKNFVFELATILDEDDRAFGLVDEAITMVVSAKEVEESIECRNKLIKLRIAGLLAGLPGIENMTKEEIDELCWAGKHKYNAWKYDEDDEGYFAWLNAASRARG